MSRSAFSRSTSRLSCAISNCSGFIVPWPGNACCGSSASCFTQLRNCVGWTPRSSDACAYDTPRSLISRTASSLNSRVNCRLSMTHLLLHKTPNSVSSEPGAAHPGVLTVEHVMPKSPGEEWIDVTAADPNLVEDCSLRLGNMCLLTDINNQLGRKNFAAKKEV